MKPGVERIIGRRRGWLQVDWAGLWRARDLLWMTVRRDFVARYQQTILGPLWFVIQPLVTALVFAVVFGQKMQTSGGPPPFLFYLGGMLAWSFFSNVLSGAGNTFNANAAVFTKVYFPRLVAPLAVAISNLVPLAIQVALFLFMYVSARVSGTASWHADPAALWLLPWCLLHTGLLALGAALLTSALSAKYRDLQHALPFVLQMGMFVTPVIFPLNQLGPTARAIALVNPLTPIVETVRQACFGEGGATAGQFALSLGITAVVAVAGLALFQRTERTFADSV